MASQLPNQPLIYIYICIGVSLHGGTPHFTPPKWSFLVGKPMVVGYQPSTSYWPPGGRCTTPFYPTSLRFQHLQAMASGKKGGFFGRWWEESCFYLGGTLDSDNLPNIQIVYIYTYVHIWILYLLIKYYIIFRIWKSTQPKICAIGWGSIWMHLGTKLSWNFPRLNKLKDLTCHAPGSPDKEVTQIWRQLTLGHIGLEREKVGSFSGKKTAIKMTASSDVTED